MGITTEKFREVRAFLQAHDRKDDVIFALQLNPCTILGIENGRLRVRIKAPSRSAA